MKTFEVITSVCGVVMITCDNFSFHTDKNYVVFERDGQNVAIFNFSTVVCIVLRSEK